jgi:hypothetical protein
MQAGSVRSAGVCRRRGAPESLSRGAGGSYDIVLYIAVITNFTDIVTFVPIR